MGPVKSFDSVERSRLANLDEVEGGGFGLLATLASGLVDERYCLIDGCRFFGRVRVFADGNRFAAELCFYQYGDLRDGQLHGYRLNFYYGVPFQDLRSGRPQLNYLECDSASFHVASCFSIYCVITAKGDSHDRFVRTAT